MSSAEWQVAHLPKQSIYQPMWVLILIYLPPAKE